MAFTKEDHEWINNETEKIMGFLTVGAIILLLLFSNSFRSMIFQSDPNAEPCIPEYSNMGDGC